MYVHVCTGSAFSSTHATCPNPYWETGGGGNHFYNSLKYLHVSCCVLNLMKRTYPFLSRQHIATFGFLHSSVCCRLIEPWDTYLCFCVLFLSVIFSWELFIRFFVNPWIIVCHGLSHLFMVHTNFCLHRLQILHVLDSRPLSDGDISSFQLYLSIFFFCRKSDFTSMKFNLPVFFLLTQAKKLSPRQITKKKKILLFWHFISTGFDFMVRCIFRHFFPVWAAAAVAVLPLTPDSWWPIILNQWLKGFPFPIEFLDILV